ncbi:YfcC family protein [Peribacillus simplex]|uniref:YfcC family protein n=1 Tax=Peribacillus simplex TaxID=1478 RepID=UPI000F636304|nr:AbgT family transporter [Peribacillus simplex]RRN68125.1 YfcC family protein [Peribacillus simplex]
MGKIAIESNNQESNKQVIKRKKINFTMPHSYVFMGMMIFLAGILTYIVPAGEFNRVEDPATDRLVVVPDSYKLIEQSPVSFFDLFLSIQKGMINAAEIIFYVLFSYGFIFMLTKTGVFNCGIGALIKKMKGKENFIVPIFMLVFGLMGATFGMYEESYGYIPLMMGIAVALGYDALVGVAIVYVGITTGFSASITNPFTIGIAQSIAKIPLFSGTGFRIIAFIAFMSLSIFYVMRYANKVKKNPDASLVKDIEFPFLSDIRKGVLSEQKFTTRHKISMILFVGTILTLIMGTVKFKWYLPELSAVLIMMMIVIGLVNKLTFAQIADTFIEACKTMVFAALIIGLANAILVVFQEGHIIDTIVHAMAYVIKDLSPMISASCMVIGQTLLNLFIPSASAAAAISMPIMTPLADLVGLNRQIAVLAFQFGDGFANMFWPHTVAVICGIACIPIDRWYKFLWPLFLSILSLEIIFVIIAVAINYGQ